MESSHRPAARVVCLDIVDRVLLLHWQDPFDGTCLWEPPGGGIDPGETPLLAARRELVEETGLDAAAVLDRWVPVERDTCWNGRRYLGQEYFFVARFGIARPVLSGTGLLPHEQAAMRGHVWVSPPELAALPDRVEPPQLSAVIRALVAGSV